MSSPPHTRSFYPALDGLRAVAFLAVFADHYGVYVSGSRTMRWGWAGVDIFFVLSGFLITGILLDTLDGPHYFRNFYVRRSLRIFPLFFALWLAVLLLTPVLGILWNRYNLAMALYFGNFFYAGSLAHLHANPGLIACTHLLPKGGIADLNVVPLWSLCVEEQFYLVWPFVVWTLRSRRALLGLCAIVVVASPVLRELYWRVSPATAMYGATYFNTLTRLDTLLTGAAIAIWLRLDGSSASSTVRFAYVLLLVPFPALVLAVRYTSPHWQDNTFSWMNDHLVNTIGFSLIAMFAAGLLLLAIRPGSWLYRLLQAPPLLAMGRRSYGLYVLHALPVYLLSTHLLPRLRSHNLTFLFLPAALAYTLCAGWLSFHYLESPFLRLKDCLAPKHGGVSDPQPVS